MVQMFKFGQVHTDDQVLLGCCKDWESSFSKLRCVCASFVWYCHDRSIRQTYTLHWCLLSTALFSSLLLSLSFHRFADVSAIKWAIEMAQTWWLVVVANAQLTGDICDHRRHRLGTLCACTFLCIQSRHTNKYGLSLWCTSGQHRWISGHHLADKWTYSLTYCVTSGTSARVRC